MQGKHHSYVFILSLQELFPCAYIYTLPFGLVLIYAYASSSSNEKLVIYAYASASSNEKALIYAYASASSRKKVLIYAYASASSRKKVLIYAYASASPNKKVCIYAYANVLLDEKALSLRDFAGCGDVACRVSTLIESRQDDIRKLKHTVNKVSSRQDFARSQRCGMPRLYIYIVLFLWGALRYGLFIFSFLNGFS